MGVSCFGAQKKIRKIKYGRRHQIKKAGNVVEDLVEFDLVFGTGDLSAYDSLTIKIQLVVECENLPKMKNKQIGNTMVVLFQLIGNELIEEGRSEINYYSWNPMYIKKFIRNYHIESNTTEELVFQIYHVDNIDKQDDLTLQTFIGEAQFSLRELVANKFQESQDFLFNPNIEGIELGKIKVKAQNCHNNYEDFKMQFGISDFVSKNPLVLKISHKTDLDKWRPIYLSNIIEQKSKYSYFEPSQIPVSECIKDKVSNQLLFEIFEIVKKEKYVTKCELQIPTSELFGKVLSESRTRDEDKIKINNLLEEIGVDIETLNKFNLIGTNQSLNSQKAKLLISEFKENHEAKENKNLEHNMNNKNMKGDVVDVTKNISKQPENVPGISTNNPNNITGNLNSNQLHPVNANNELNVSANSNNTQNRILSFNKMREIGYKYQSQLQLIQELLEKSNTKEKRDHENAEGVIELLMQSKNHRYRNYLLIKNLEIVKVFRFYDYLVSNLELKSFFFMDLTRSKINVDYLDTYATFGAEVSKDNEEMPSYLQGLEDDQKEGKIFTDSNEESENKQQLLLDQDEDDQSEGSFKNQIGRKRMKVKKKKNLEEDENDEKNQQVLEKLDLVNIKEEFQTCLDMLIKNLIKLDSSRGFPLFGFGAKLPPLYDSVNNCFAMTMDIMRPEVDGYLGFFDAYTNILGKIDLYGPANLGESLESLIKFLTHEKFNHKEQFYAIAVFLVTSRITDLVHSIKLINKSSYFPCTVIVIGAGYEFQLENQKGYEEYNYLNKLTDESVYEEIKENYNMVVKERPLRNNSIFVDFYSLFDQYGQGLRKEAVFKPILKKIFNDITKQFLEFVQKRDVTPIDYINLQKKTHAHFIEFKKDKLNEEYEIPYYLQVEKEFIISKIKEIGFTETELNIYIPVLPSFEMHYIISTLNYHKHFKVRRIQENPLDKVKNKKKKYIYVNGIAMIDERRELKKNREKDFFEKIISQVRRRDKVLALKQKQENEEMQKVSDSNLQYLSQSRGQSSRGKTERRNENDNSKSNTKKGGLSAEELSDIARKNIERRRNRKKYKTLEDFEKELNKEHLALLSSSEEEIEVNNKAYIDPDDLMYNLNRYEIVPNRIGTYGKNLYAGKTGYDMMKKFGIEKKDLIVDPNDPNFIIDENFFDPRYVKNKKDLERRDSKEIENYNRTICNICSEKEINICYIPCKHMYICEYCVLKDGIRCRICNIPIKKKVKIYNLHLFHERKEY